MLSNTYDTPQATSHYGVTKKSGHASLNTPCTLCLLGGKEMATESAAFYFGRLVVALKENPTPECRECSERLTCAVNEVLHSRGSVHCGCTA
jgi:hypothetical protein